MQIENKVCFLLLLVDGFGRCASERFPPSRGSSGSSHAWPRSRGEPWGWPRSTSSRGRSAFLNPDETFPMASTYKVPIAVQLLHRVDRGELRLSKMISFEPGNLSPGSGTISRLLDDPGLSISLHNLLELMLLISDNSATDSCLREAGGGASVTRRMKDIGIEGIRVDRSTLHVISGLDRHRGGFPCGRR